MTNLVTTQILILLRIFPFSQFQSISVASALAMFFLVVIKWAGLLLLLLLCSRWRRSAPPSPVLSVKLATPISIRATSFLLHRFSSSTTEQQLQQCIQTICLESVSSLTLGPSDIVGSSDIASCDTKCEDRRHKGGACHTHMLFNSTWTLHLIVEVICYSLQ